MRKASFLQNLFFERNQTPSKFETFQRFYAYQNKCRGAGGAAPFCWTRSQAKKISALGMKILYKCYNFNQKEIERKVALSLQLTNACFKKASLLPYLFCIIG
jgi:hypothetical protein